MTSQLNVDTIVDKAGSGGSNIKMANTSTYVSDGGNVTQNVVQGLAKFWCNTSADGTTINDSLNTTSLSDLGTGQQRPAFGNNMSTANYAPELTPVNNINQIWCQNVESGQFTSKSYTGSAFQDSQHFTTVHGDLA
jgi:hypothetical protein